LVIGSVLLEYNIIDNNEISVMDLSRTESESSIFLYSASFGNVHIRLLSADLNENLVGKTKNLYMVFKFDGEERVSSVVTNVLSPVWNEGFNIYNI
jgi:Ca2+-dependent lipid-binding protein